MSSRCSATSRGNDGADATAVPRQVDDAAFPHPGAEKLRELRPRIRDRQLDGIVRSW